VTLFIRQIFSNLVILPSIEIMVVLLSVSIVARARWSPLPSDVILDPNRANFGIASTFVSPHFHCLTSPPLEYKHMELGDHNVFDSNSVKECAFILETGATNYGPAPMLPGYAMSASIFLEDHFLSKEEEDTLFRARRPSFGAFGNHNPLEGNRRQIVPFTVRSPSYSQEELRRWLQKVGSVLLMEHSYYSDSTGPIYTEECFYLLPPDFLLHQRECEDHTGSHSVPQYHRRLW
jgi:hypothetical protein